jgi:hypothetical protein
MSVSGLMADILDLLLPVLFYGIVLVTIVTGHPENIGFAVETVFLSCLHADI